MECEKREASFLHNCKASGAHVLENELNYVDLRGIKTLACRGCGMEYKYTPRKPTREQLDHFEEVRQFRYHLAPHIDSIENFRAVICRNCGTIHLGYDEYSSVRGSPEYIREFWNAIKTDGMNK